MIISGRDPMITQRGKCVWFIAWCLPYTLIRQPAITARTVPDGGTALCVLWLNWDRLGAITWCNNLILLLSDWPDCASAAPNRERAGGLSESDCRLSRLTWTDESRNIGVSQNIPVVIFSCLCVSFFCIRHFIVRTTHKRQQYRGQIALIQERGGFQLRIIHFFSMHSSICCFLIILPYLLCAAPLC